MRINIGSYEDGTSDIIMPVGVFLINIDIKGDEFASSEGYASIIGEGMLSIAFDTMKHSGQGPSKDASEEEKILDLIKRSDVEVFLPMVVCFGQKEDVPATPENIAKAFQWCLSNQNFMKDQEGI